jgi:hypothetical protein
MMVDSLRSSMFEEANFARGLNFDYKVSDCRQAVLKTMMHTVMHRQTDTHADRVKDSQRVYWSGVCCGAGAA